MDFEWDDAKARANLREHGVDFADAATVFEDDSALTIPEVSTEEDRHLMVAMDALGRILVVAYTERRLHSHHLCSKGQSIRTANLR